MTVQLRVLEQDRKGGTHDVARTDAQGGSQLDEPIVLVDACQARDSSPHECCPPPERSREGIEIRACGATQKGVWVLGPG